jgi:hypothetical protein
VVEVLVAALVLVVGVLSLLSVLDTANASTASVRARDAATSLTRQLIEGARSIPYSALTPLTLEDALQQQPGLGSDGGSAAWSVQRQNVRYAVAATVCAVDDPSDGVGPHDGGVYCSDSTATGTTDRNPDDYKRVTIDVTWTSDGLAGSHNHQVAVINNPGSAGGPAVTNLTVNAPAAALITTNLSGAAFSASTSVPAASVVFSVDGVATAPAIGNSAAWTFQWPILDLVDGTHLVTAQAFDRQGLSGATRSVTVTLNRFAPAAPSGLAGGRNGAVVDLEWLPNPERDVAGYRVFRGVAGLGPQLVCPLTRETACEDTDPPAGLPGLLLTYFVVADDLSPSGQYRDGLPSLPITVLTLNRAPNPPTQLTASQFDGATKLSWVAASPADPDGGEVAFYRVYRDGLGFDNRYDRTGLGSELSILDGRSDGVSHHYWITAVDDQLAESAPVGPVTM